MGGDQLGYDRGRAITWKVGHHGTIAIRTIRNKQEITTPLLGRLLLPVRVTDQDPSVLGYEPLKPMDYRFYQRG
jgi:hypothetical protein